MTPKSETRERILEEAARLFHEQGYSATGISTILRRAGVNSGSLYHFFPGKDALLIGVLERHLGLLEPFILLPAEGASSDPIERVFALLEVYRRGLLVSGCTRGCPVGNLALELGDRKPRARALMNEYFAAWTGRVQTWLGAADDRLPAQLDRESLSRLVLAVMEGGVMQARAAGSIDPFDAAVAQLRSYSRLLASYSRREPAEAFGSEEESFLEPVEAAEPAEAADASGWRYW
jgi:AcrR family transcriptional regulator